VETAEKNLMGENNFQTYKSQILSFELRFGLKASLCSRINAMMKYMMTGEPTVKKER
jgi:hypothetical protein